MFKIEPMDCPSKLADEFFYSTESNQSDLQYPMPVDKALPLIVEFVNFYKALFF